MSLKMLQETVRKVRSVSIILVPFLSCISLGGATAQEANQSAGAISNDACSAQMVGLDQYTCITEPSVPHISKEGDKIAYLYADQVHVIAATGGVSWRPTDETWSWSPVWSNDGQALYFFSARSELTKLNRVAIDGNRELSQLVCIRQSVDQLKLSPDEKRFLLEVRGAERSSATDLLLPLSVCESEVVSGQKSENMGRKVSDLSRRAVKLEGEPIVISAMLFKQDNTGYLANEEQSRVYAVDIGSNRLTQLTGHPEDASAGEQSYDTAAIWSPDGSQVVFIREYPASLEYHSEVWTTSAMGEGHPVKLTSWPKAERRKPSWSNDSKLIAYLWSDAHQGPFAITQLAIYSLADKQERVLTTTLDRPVVSFHFSQDNRFIYFVYAEEGGQHLARIRLSDGQIDQILRGPQFISAFDINRDGDIALIKNEINDSAELYSIQSGVAPRQITRLNERYFQRLALGSREKVMIDIGEGLHMEAFVTKPADFDESRRYPTVLHIHGGPSNEQHSYGYKWFPQFMAANGYVVVEPNPPGSFGRGQKNVSKIYRNWGCTDYPDILLAIDYLIATGVADPERLGVTGYSYGGYMTNCIITRTPKKFKAAAVGAGHSLIAANYGHDTWLKWYKWELGTPWLNPQVFEELSPLSRVGLVETPTLFLAGDADWNVPILNSELFYQALRIKGVETQLVVYPGKSHGNWGEQLDKDYYQRILDWFNRHLKP